jgi:hypothetical protein
MSCRVRDDHAPLSRRQIGGKVHVMDVAFSIPDELAERVGAADEVSRRALEAFSRAECQAGRLFESDLCQLLGFSRYELDGFLKERGILHDYTLAELEREQETLDRLGF